MKSFFSKFLQNKSNPDPSLLIRLRTARFRHLLRQYGRIVALSADAAEKQSGEYILDKAYLFFLVDAAFETVEGMIYDLNVLAGQRYTNLYDVSESLWQKTTALFKEEAASPSDHSDREEPEYSLLRKIRKMLFDEELSDDSAGSNLFQIVQSVQKAAADSMASLMQGLATVPSVEKNIRCTKVSIIDLMKGLTESNESSLVSDLSSIESAATRDFLTAFLSSELWKTRPGEGLNTNLVASGLEDSTTASFFHNGGYDLFDAFVSCSLEANHIYCRFSCGEKAPVVSGILQKLGFSVSRTKGELVGWIASQPFRETASRLQAVAKLATFVLQPHPSVPAIGVEDEVNRFLNLECGSLAGR